jgi:BirA family transcriptional regulator, biotin operon repressor / biotin---[acetyl-CoA-carboxylase] ligase
MTDGARLADPGAAESRSIVRLASVDSTQTVAFALAEGGARDGTVVVADTQRQGHGRQGRPWHDEPGQSLLMSLLWRPRLPLPALPTLSLLAAVAVAEAAGDVAAVIPRVKWPNDVLVGGRKLAGILLESRIGAEVVVVLGIGVNLAQASFPPALRERATSLFLETGRAPGRDEMLGAVLAALDGWRARLEAEGFASLRERWRTLSSTLGARVRIGDLAGVAVDLDADGALLVDDGATVVRVVAGEIAEETGRAARA